MELFERILEETKDTMEKTANHPFLCSLADGSLPQEKFRYYILQDYWYLREYAKVFGIGIAKAKDLEIMRTFSWYVSVLTDEEMDLHRGYMRKLQIKKEEVECMVPSLINRSYTSYMLRIAYEEGETEILTAILYCAYSYEYFAKALKEKFPDALQHSFYGEWIQSYADEAYSNQNKRLITRLEQSAKHCSEQKIQHLIEIFSECARFEKAFWDMAWKME